LQLPLRAIYAFHTAAKARSISKAAAELSVTPSAISQQIQLLEVQLGTSLMVKAGRHIALTETGERYFASISEQLDQVVAATNELRGFRSVVTLNVRATPTLSHKWLLPRLPSLIDAHPDLEVRLDGTNEPTDFDKESVDIEIRHGDGAWPGLYVEGFAEESFQPVCAPSYAAAGSLLPSDLLDYRLIHSVKAQAQWARWFHLAGLDRACHWKKVSFDRSHMAIDAAVRGLGIALESTLMTERELAEGLLVSPVRDGPPIRLTTQWIVCPRAHLAKRKVRIFLEWLQRERQGPHSGAVGRASARPRMPAGERPTPPRPRPGP
jgi:DNA-binding transcriptional LysR family regulator